MSEVLSQHSALAVSSTQKKATQSMLQHQKELFHSASLRVASLNARIINIINLVCIGLEPVTCCTTDLARLVVQSGYSAG
jgi:hypothetical protein